MDKILEILRSEIAMRGAIPFSRFMQVALYCPVYGFYEAEEDRVGRHGSFYTSVSVGSLFGELLAWQFMKWLEEARKVRVGGEIEQLCLVEAGAHGGQLASDILKSINANHPGLGARLEYRIIEPSNRRREWQRKRLERFCQRVRWFESLSDLKEKTPGGVVGVMFANELLDAFPVHRISWDSRAGKWFEWGVTIEGGKFVWARHDSVKDQNRARVEEEWLDMSSVSERFGFSHELLKVLPDGFAVEVCPSAEKWWRQAGDLLRSGKLMAFDYGLSAEEWIVPERTGGTLRGYRNHHLMDDVLADPGMQDLTAHVNFTAVQAAGEAVGLRTEIFETQGRFLGRIATALNEENERIGEWARSRARQLQTLIHPEHLGSVMRVLVQGRGQGDSCANQNR